MAIAAKDAANSAITAQVVTRLDRPAIISRPLTATQYRPPAAI